MEVIDKASLMDRETFAKRLSDALDKDLLNLEGSTTLDQLDWDSLSAITFIALAGDLLSKNIDAEQVHNAKTLDDLLGICF